MCSQPGTQFALQRGEIASGRVVHDLVVDHVVPMHQTVAKADCEAEVGKLLAQCGSRVQRAPRRFAQNRQLPLDRRTQEVVCCVLACIGVAQEVEDRLCRFGGVKQVLVQPVVQKAASATCRRPGAGKRSPKACR